MSQTLDRSTVDAGYDLVRRGEISQAILDNYDGGPERLVAALIEKFGMPEKPVHFDHDLLTTSIKTEGSQIVFAARIDTKQIRRHRHGGTEEDFPGADYMYADLRRRARQEAKARAEAVGQMLDELRIPYDITVRKDDGGWQVAVDGNAIDSAFQVIGEHDLTSGGGRNAAMQAFWEERDQRPDQQFGQAAGTKAAEAVGSRLALGRKAAEPSLT